MRRFAENGAGLGVLSHNAYAFFKHLRLCSLLQQQNPAVRSGTRSDHAFKLLRYGAPFATPVFVTSDLIP
jgi:hypothetical protein